MEGCKDVMTIDTLFTKKLIARIIKKAIKKKTQANVEIFLDKLSVGIDDADVSFTISLSGSMKKEDLNILLKDLI